ncbi:Telomerase reverse transcriptase [Fusarium piperis]|uniref:Telomerase reverse transcriptase n=1 Tax=Fusarium piperis TaxID=1435070 RepID=A0A9W8WI64_9HYPO|nr:Telomerase reverse transcriptase [Fusarium piperis]
MSLHEMSQDLKADITWLQPPGSAGQKPSKTDTAKRHEIFHEFLYFVFDSLLIPLIRNNFYVTESNTHRYQVFYFRHEVWKHIAEPAMADLKADMFEEVRLDEALAALQSRRLGFSQAEGFNSRSLENPGAQYQYHLRTGPYVAEAGKGQWGHYHSRIKTNSGI